MSDSSPLRATLRAIRSHPRLLVYPASAGLVTLLLFPLVGWSLTAGVAGVAETIGRESGIGARTAWPVVLAVGVVAVTALFVGILAFHHVALARATYGTMMNDEVSISRTIATAIRAWPILVAYSLVAGAGGLGVGIVERALGNGGRSHWFAALGGAPYAALTYLLAPVAALEEPGGPRTAFRRSATLLERQFGVHAVPSVGILEASILIAAVPLVFIQTALIIAGIAGASVLAPIVRAVSGSIWIGALVTLWLGVLVGTTLGTIAKTSLYIAITTDRESLPLLGVSVDMFVTPSDRISDDAPEESTA